MDEQTTRLAFDLGIMDSSFIHAGLRCLGSDPRGPSDPISDSSVRA